MRIEGSVGPCFYYEFIEILGGFREAVTWVLKNCSFCEATIFLLVVRGLGGKAIELCEDPSFNMLTY